MDLETYRTFAHIKKDNDERRKIFLEKFAECGNVTHSAKLAGIARRTAYDWRDADPEFAEEWKRAEFLGAESLEEEAHRRAKEGVLEPVFQGGKHVGDVRRFSDTLMIFLLKGKKPDVYKDRVAAEHSGRGGTPIVFTHGVVSNDIDEKIAESERRIAALEAIEDCQTASEVTIVLDDDEATS